MHLAHLDQRPTLDPSAWVAPTAVLCGDVDEAFLATGTTIFHGARVGRRAEVRINGVVHVNSTVPPDGLVPIGWVAVGTPAVVLPPSAHERIWEMQRPLNFPRVAYGVDRQPDGSVDMREITRRVAEGLRRHGEDHQVDQ